MLPIVKDSIVRKFFMLWLCSALLVTLVRLVYPGPLSYDLALQIQAAQNLLAGKGLSIYEHWGPEADLAAPARLITLTLFPSGYSLVAAGLLAVGCSVGMAVKLLAAAGTMMGWWGWARLARPFFSEGLRRGVVWKWAAFLIAVLTPLLFTTHWAGTDVFLWASVPWVLEWLVRASREDTSRAARFDVLAGALCGFAILMRYSSLFLAVYAAVIVIWQSRTRIAVLACRSAFFGLGLLPAVTLQTYILYALSSAPATPGALTFNLQAGLIVQRLLHGLPLLRTAAYPWAFWFPGFALQLLFPAVTGGIPWQLGITLTLCIYVFLGIVIKTYGLSLDDVPRDSRTVACGLFLAFPLLLWSCMMFGQFDSVSEPRYYTPIIPLSLFSMCSVAASRNVAGKRGLTNIARGIGAIYITGFIIMSLASVALFLASGERGALERSRLIGSSPAPWPSTGLASEFSPASKFVKEVVRRRPNTLLMTSSKNSNFVWDATLDRSRIHELSCGEWLQATYISGPARIVILTFDEGNPTDLWSADGGHGLEHVSCFERLPNLNLLQRFPLENLKVLEARVPENSRFMLRP
jgi:hypothetical protein